MESTMIPADKCVLLDILSMYGFSIENVNSKFYLKVRVLPSEKAISYCHFGDIVETFDDFFYDHNDFRHGKDNKYYRKRVFHDRTGGTDQSFYVLQKSSSNSIANHSHFYVETQCEPNAFYSDCGSVKPFLTYKFIRRTSPLQSFITNQMEVHLDEIIEPMFGYKVITFKMRLAWDPSQLSAYALNCTVMDFFEKVLAIESEIKMNVIKLNRSIINCITDPSIPYFPTYTKFMFVLLVTKNKLYRDVFAKSDPASDTVTKRVKAFVQVDGNMSLTNKMYVFTVSYLPDFYLHARQFNSNDAECFELIAAHRKEFLNDNELGFDMNSDDEDDYRNCCDEC